jgi:hypothetical protein
MEKKQLIELRPSVYEHPFDRQALISLEQMPGVSLLFKKINEYGLDRLFRFTCTANNIRVNERNFPELYEAFIEACDILDLEAIPELYLLHGTGYIRTFTIGVKNPIVIINVDGMKQLTFEELVYVFGHELGHIKSKHLLYHQASFVLPALGKVIANSTLGFGGLVTNGIELALYQWVIMAKLTCDRAGLLACQDKDVAITALMKQGGVPRECLNSTVIEEFIEQAHDFDSYSLDNIDKITKIFSFMESMRPWAILRASELIKWVDSGEYLALIEGNNLQITEEVGEWGFLESWETSNY